VTGLVYDGRVREERATAARARSAIRPAWRRYAVAVAITLAAWALRYALIPVLGGGFSFLLAFPAATFAAWYGGLGPGLLSTALSAMGAALLLAPDHSLLEPSSYVRLAVFSVSGVLISLLSESLHEVTRRAASAAADRGDVQRMLADAQALAHVGSWELGLANLEDIDANPLRWSDETYRIFGHQPGAVVVSNRLFFDAVHPDDRDLVRMAVSRALREHTPYQIEHRIVWPDGSERHLHEHGTVVCDAAGRPLRMLGTCQDITERKRAETTLREREDLLRLITDTAPTLISYIDDKFTYRMANRAYESWFGKPLAELPGHTVSEILGEATWRAVRGYMERALAGETVDFEQELPYHKVGSRWVHVIYTPDRDPSGRVRGFVVFVHDVSDRKRVEDALRRSAERAERLRGVAVALAQALTEEQVARVIVEQGLQILGAVGGCVAVAGDDGDTLRVVQSTGWDPAARSAWERFSIDAGAPMAQAARTRLPVFVASPEERARVYPELPSFLGQGPSGASASIPMLLGDRLLGVLDLTWAETRPLGDDDRAFVLALGRQCAQALERAELYAAEQRARARAEASDRAKDQFLAVLSHELRTPLTPVLGAAAMLETDAAASDEVRRLAAMIRKNAELEARLIDDLLDLTRVNQGKLSLQVEPVDAHAKVTDVVRACEADLEAKHLRLDIDLAATDHQVHADQARLQQVIWNLVKNAAKFSNAYGRIAIRTRNDTDGMMTLEVADQGIGIEPDLLSRLFQPFEQGGREVTRHFGGLGLGLAISKALVEAQGGSIVAASPGKNRGATFTLRLPLAHEAARALPVAPAPRPAPGHRILLVEDNADTAELLAELLQLHGYGVKTADTVASALRLADAEKFDLIVSDLGLPDGTGLDLMRQLGARHRLPGVALSGYGFERDIQEARAAGFWEHLTKPVNPGRLLQVLSSVLARAEGRPSS
jgi:PAS domain S-box-containing protein